MKSIQTTKDLKNRLAQLSKAISYEIEDPNSGGCGVIAGKVGKALQKLGVECEVVTPVDHSASWMQPPVRVRSNVKHAGSCYDWDRNGLDRTHLAVRIKHKKSLFCWDSDGITKKKNAFGICNEYRAPENFGEGLTVEECVKISSKQKGWNRSFCRSQIPAITKLVRKHLLNGETY